MYKFLSNEFLIESFPILNCEEEIILFFISKDGVCLHPTFNAIKQLNSNVEKIIYKNCIVEKINEGELLLLKIHNGKKVLIMPIQETWKDTYNAEYVHQGFIKISNVYKEKNLNSIAIQEGIVQNEYIDKLIGILDLPKITYYQNKE